MTTLKRILFIASVYIAIVVPPSTRALHLPTMVRFQTSREDYDWKYGDSAEKTYLFTNCHWWESIDHQLTTIITLLTVAQNTSSIAVIPPLASASTQRQTNSSLLGQYFDIERIAEVQPVLTLESFLNSMDYEKLTSLESGSIALPKESLEEYESKLGIFGRLQTSAVHMDMPALDPENTNQPCHRFSGTMQLSADGRRRYVFLDRMHFLHFCTERFMPWWYDVRLHIRPRRAYMDVAKRFVQGVRRPLTVVHINDVMEAQKARELEDVEKYAGEIVDGLRRHESVDKGSVYAIYNKNGRNVGRVVKLLRGEFERVYDCTNLFSCLREVTADMVTSERLPDLLFQKMFAEGEHAAAMTEWAVAAHADLFIGNVHSPFSRNVCLYRKMQGRTYVIVRGFAELRKVWKWNL